MLLSMELNHDIVQKMICSHDHTVAILTWVATHPDILSPGGAQERVRARRMVRPHQGRGSGLWTRSGGIASRYPRLFILHPYRGASPNEMPWGGLASHPPTSSRAAL